MSSERAAQLIEAGMWLRMTGDLEGARTLFEKALALDPSSARARQLLADERIGANPVVRRTPTPPPMKRPQSLAPPLPPPTPPLVPPVAPSGTMIFGGRDAPLPPPSTTPGQGGSQTLVFAGAPVPIPPQAAVPPPPPDAPGQTLLFATPGPPMPPVAGPPTISSAWDEQIPSSAEAIEVCAFTSGPDAMAMLDAPPAPPVPTPAPSASGRRRTHVEDEVDALLAGVKDLTELDDHSGAMDLLLKAEELAPNDPRVRDQKARSEQILLTRYESKLGDLQHAPRMRLKQDEIIWLNLDHRAGFVLAQIDGTVSYDDLFAVCGMSRIDTARILAQLVDEGVIA